MFDWLSWFTHMENTKPFVLVLFSITFIFILIYVFSNKNRSKRFESYKNIPFHEDEFPEDKDGQSKDIKDEH
jgi:cbb3-type cytochrome oxidase subunit 3